MPSGQSFDGNESKRLTMFGWSMLFHTYPPIGTVWYPAHSRRPLLPVGSVVFAHADRHVGVVSERQYWRALTGPHGYSRVLTGGTRCGRPTRIESAATRALRVAFARRNAPRALA